MSDSSSLPESPVRVVVIYRLALFRDIVAHLLTKAGVDVGAIARSDEVARLDWEALRADVVVADRSADRSSLRQVLEALFLHEEPGYPTRVVLIDLREDLIAVYTKSVVPQPTAPSIVEAVLGARAPTATDHPAEV